MIANFVVNFLNTWLFTKLLLLTSQNLGGQMHCWPPKRKFGGASDPRFYRQRTPWPASNYSVLDERQLIEHLDFSASLNFSLCGSASSSLVELVTSSRNGLAAAAHQRAHNGSLLTAAAAHSRLQIQVASNSSGSIS